jgi:tetratricopeptide (TPR) repeat protein
MAEPSPRAKAKESENQGDRLVDSKKYADALSFYKTAVTELVKILPESYLLISKLHEKRAECYFELGDYMSSAREYKRAFGNFKNADKKNKDYAEAAEYFKGMAVCYFRLGNYEEAIYCYDKAIDYYRKAKRLINYSAIGECYEGKGDCYSLMVQKHIKKSEIDKAIENLYTAERRYNSAIGNFVKARNRESEDRCRDKKKKAVNARRDLIWKKTRG